MAGTVIRVVPKTFFTFSGVPGNAPGPTTLWLARKIDVSPWTELTAVIRLHSGTSITGGAWTSPPTISAYADGFTDEDPSVFPGFTKQIGTPQSLGTSTTGPTMFLMTVAAGSGSGSLIAFALAGQVNVVPTTSDIYLSMDLSGKALRGPGVRGRM